MSNCTCQSCAEFREQAIFVKSSGELLAANQAKVEATQTFIQMLKNRICFDNLEGRGCDHQLCYGLENLILDLEAGKAE